MRWLDGITDDPAQPKIKKSISKHATLWTVALQAPLCMGFSRQEYWSGLPFPSPGDLPDPGIEPARRVGGLLGVAGRLSGTVSCRRPVFDPWGGKILWRREWLPTSVFLPGKSHAQRSLEGYSPWGRKGSDTTEQLCTPQSGPPRDVHGVI